jgi:hypothetical protein
MSKACQIRSISSSLWITLDWCKRTASRYLGWARRVIFSSSDGRANEQFEIGRLTTVKQRLQVDWGGNPMEFDDFCQSLSIGDRIRVLCDDGVLVAEKISQTQFELVHSQPISQFIQ